MVPGLVSVSERVSAACGLTFLRCQSTEEGVTAHQLYREMRSRLDGTGLDAEVGAAYFLCADTRNEVLLLVCGGGGQNYAKHTVSNVDIHCFFAPDMEFMTWKLFKCLCGVSSSVVRRWVLDVLIKIFDKSDLIKLCISCLLFKKYWRFNLWSKKRVEIQSI